MKTNMNTFYYSLFFLLSYLAQAIRHKEQTLISSVNVAPYTWALLETQDQPPARQGHSSVRFEDKIYIFGGCDLKGHCYNDMYSFDTNTLKWEKVETQGISPNPREGHIAILLGNSMYVFGGNLGEKYYDDTQIFDFDNNAWRVGDFSGEQPSKRTYHSAVMDYKKRIIIYGGFAETGYFGDLYILDPKYGKWEKPQIDGNAPNARKSPSMTRVDKTIWIIGGRDETNTYFDINILDLEEMNWSTLETAGTSPAPREGHKAILIEKEILLFGGCDPEIEDCFQDYHYLNVDTHWWEDKADQTSNDLARLHYFTADYIGGKIFLFGGCSLAKKCSNNIYIYNTNIECPNECSGHGECQSHKCVCKHGFFENDCSLGITCPSDCSENGLCQLNGKCACYPGYTGLSCSIEVECNKNCTSPDNGRCLANGECKCNDGFFGDACEEGEHVDRTCPNNCNGHGTCDKSTGKCNCDDGITGEECTMKINYDGNGKLYYTDVLQEDQAKAESEKFLKDALAKDPRHPPPVVQEEEEPEPAKIKSPYGSYSSSEEDESESSEQIYIDAPVTNSPVTNPRNQPIETQTNPPSETPKETTNTQQTTVIPEGANETPTETPSDDDPAGLTPAMFGEALIEKAMAPSDAVFEQKIDQAGCPNLCMNRGICQNKMCFCVQGFTGEDCSIPTSQFNEEPSGEPMNIVLKYSLVCLGIGLFIGCICLISLLRKAEQFEYQDIGNPEQNF